MTLGWKKKTLCSVLKLEYGKPLENDYRKSNGLYPAYGANGEKTRTDKYYHDKPSIIVGRKGSAGEINLTEGRFWPLDVTYFVTFDEKNYDLRFLFYLLTTLNLPSLAKGVKPGINRNDVYSKKVKIPLIDEQKRIVSILDESFKAIDIAKANTEKNLQNARALFDSILFNSIGTAKKGWEKKRIGEVATTQYGLSLSMNTEGKGYKIFRMGEVQDGRLIDTGSMKYVDIDEAEFQKYKLFPGDVLFNRTNSFELVGKTGIFESDGNYCFASYLIRVRQDESTLTSKYLNYFLNSNRFQEQIKKKASKSINQANINATILSNEIIWLPASLDEQNTIVNNLDKISAKIKGLESTYQKKLIALEELKKSLLHQAFNGGL